VATAFAAFGGWFELPLVLPSFQALISISCCGFQEFSSGLFHIFRPSSFLNVHICPFFSPTRYDTGTISGIIAMEVSLKGDETVEEDEPF